MKIATTILGALTLAGLAIPAQAAVTTVTKVHGPVKLLPHHDRKICKISRVHHKRVKRCWYH